MNSESLNGDWAGLWDKLLHFYPQVSDDDLRQVEGKEELIGIIQRRTGESRAEIERRIRKILAE